MKITKIEAVYPSYKETLNDWRPNLWQIITKIYTDNNKIYVFIVKMYYIFSSVIIKRIENLSKYL